MAHITHHKTCIDVHNTSLRYSDIAYAVWLSRAGQADIVADSLLARFRREPMHAELSFSIRAMFALLRDVGAFL